MENGGDGGPGAKAGRDSRAGRVRGGGFEAVEGVESLGGGLLDLWTGKEEGEPREGKW